MNTTINGFTLTGIPKDPAFGFGHDESHPLTNQRRTTDIVHVTNPDGTTWYAEVNGNLIMGDNAAIDDITDAQWNDLKAAIAGIFQA